MTIAIIEPFLMVRAMLVHTCAAGHRVVAAEGTGEDGVRAALALQPDLVMANVLLPDMDGLEMAARLRKALVRVPYLLVLSSGCNRHTAFRVERAYVQGFFDLSTEEPAGLHRALETIGSGRTYYSDSFCRHQLERHSDPASHDKLLTDRERIVLELIASLLTDEEIAGSLRISERTVETHRLAIQNKLRARCRVELLRCARDLGVGSNSRAPFAWTAKPGRICAA